MTEKLIEEHHKEAQLEEKLYFSFHKFKEVSKSIVDEHIKAKKMLHPSLLREEHKVDSLAHFEELEKLIKRIMNKFWPEEENLTEIEELVKEDLIQIESFGVILGDIEKSHRIIMETLLYVNEMIKIVKSEV